MPKPFNDAHTVPLTFYVVPGKFCHDHKKTEPCVYLVEDPPPDDKWGCCYCSLIDQPLPKDEKGRIHKDEYCLEAAFRKRHIVEMIGCDDRTTFELPLNQPELDTVIKICKASRKASLHSCQPTMSVYLKADCNPTDSCYSLTYGVEDLSQ